MIQRSGSKSRRVKAPATSLFFLASVNPAIASGAFYAPPTLSHVPLAPPPHHFDFAPLGTPVGIKSSDTQPFNHTNYTSKNTYKNIFATPNILHTMLPTAGSINFGGTSMPQVSRSVLAAQGLDLNLGSSTTNVILGTRLFNNQSDASVTITVGGSAETLRAGQSVTAGEYVAIQQVLGDGKQTIVLDSQGQATGGTFSLKQDDNKNVAELVIPTGVTALDNFAGSGKQSTSTDILNFGDIYGYSTNSHLANGTISALAITNEGSGLISTVLPSSLASAVGSADASIGLTLKSSNDISNAGNIQSNGNINLLTGSGNVNNSGNVSSNNGNININTLSPNTDLNLNAVGGTFSAQSGDISMREQSYSGTANININGGNYLSNNLNIYAGNGNLTGSVGNITGNLNSTGNAGHFVADSSVLKLGTITDKGDPTYANTEGDIELTGDVTAGESIAILASGNIYIPSSASVQISTTQSGGSVTLVAGANVTINGGGSSASSLPGGTDITNGGTVPGATATVDFSQGSGGSIDLKTNNTNTGVVIDTSTSAANTNGGNVTLAAYANGSTGGTITLPGSPGSAVINTSASSFRAQGGDVLILAGASNASSAISIGGDILTGGGTGGSGGVNGQGGSVQIYNAQPDSSASNHQVTFDSTGSATTGSIQPSGGLSTPVLQAGSGILLGNVITVGQGGQSSAGQSMGSIGGSIALSSNGNITVNGSLESFGAGGVGGFGGDSSQNASSGGIGGNGGAITVLSQNGTVQIDGDVNSSGGGGGGGGGNYLASSGGSAGNGGSAGAISLSALGTTGSVSVTGNVLAAAGGAGGQGGSGVGGGGGGGGGTSLGGGGGGGGGGGVTSGGGGTGGGYNFGDTISDGANGADGSGTGAGSFGQGAASVATFSFIASPPIFVSPGAGGAGGSGGGAGGSGGNVQAGSGGGSDGSIAFTASSIAVGQLTYGGTVSITNAPNVAGTGLNFGGALTANNSLTISDAGAGFLINQIVSTPTAILSEAVPGSSITLTQLQAIGIGGGTVNLTADAVGFGGNVNITVAPNTSINVTNATVGATTYVNQAASYTLDAGNGSQITLANGISAQTQIQLIANGGISGSGLLAAPVVSLTNNNNGDIGATGQGNGIQTSTFDLTVNNAIGSAYIQNTGAVNLTVTNIGTNLQLSTTADTNGDGAIILASAITASGQVTLSSSGSGNGLGGISDAGGFTISAPNITLTDSPTVSGVDSIGTVAQPILIATTAASVNLAVNINNSMGDAAISSSSPLVLAGTGQPVASAANNLTITAASLQTNGTTIAGGVLTLNALTALTIQGTDQLGGASVVVSGFAGQNLTINNSGTLTAQNGDLFISSTPSGSSGGNIFISGGGTIGAANNININAANGGIANNITFNGAQSFSAFDTYFTAAGNSQAVDLNGQTITLAAGQLVINAPTVTSGGSTVSFMQQTPGTSLTIVNQSVSDYTISNMTVVGGNVAIISEGGITDGGTPTTINLSWPVGAPSGGNGGDGGNLTLIAGFNFTGSGPYTLTGSQNSGENISLGNTTIDTSGALSGGNVLAVATGSVTMSSINTGNNGGSPSGNVTIIGGTGVTLNSPLIAGLQVGTGNPTYFGGTISIIAAPPSTTGLTVGTGGAITSGSFTTGTAALGDNISLQGIVASAISLNAPQGSINSNGAVSAPILLLNAGGSGIGQNQTFVTNAQYIDAVANGGGAAVAFANTFNGSTVISINSGSSVNITNYSYNNSNTQLSIVSGGVVQVYNQGVTILNDVAEALQPINITSATNGPGYSQIQIFGNVGQANAFVTLDSGHGLGGTTGIAQYAGTITGNSITLSDESQAGNIGSATAPLLLNTNSISVTTNGSVYLSNGQAATLNAATAGFNQVFSLVNSGTITLNSNIAASAGTLNSISLIALGGGITNPGVMLTAQTVALFATDSLGTMNYPIFTQASNIAVQSVTGSSYVENIGSFTIGLASVAPGGTLFFDAASDASGNGQITIGSNLVALDGTIQLFTSGSTSGYSNGIVESIGNPGTLIAASVNMSDYSGNAGANYGTSNSPILTQAGTVGASTTGSVYISNTGSVLIAGGSAGTGDIFSLVTTPDAQGNGQIIVVSTISVPSGTVLLQSSEAGSGQGGIVGSGSAPIIAQQVSLSDGVAGSGTGTGNIGGTSTVTAVQTQAQLLSLYTGGNAFVNNTGSVTLLNSFAGSNQTLEVTTTEDGSGNGRITIEASQPITAGTIILNATGSNVNNSGIAEGGSAALEAGQVTLIDGNAGTGVGNIGSANSFVQIETGNLTVQTTGSAFISNNGTGGSGASATINVTNQSTAAELDLVAFNGGGITVLSSPIANTIILDCADTGSVVLNAALSAVASAVNGNGGSITLTGANVVNNTSSALLISANGSNSGSGTVTGNGGSISIEATGNGNPLPLTLTLESGLAGAFVLVANAGTAAGSGGQISASADQGNLSVSTSGFSVTPGSSGGNGGSISLNAGQAINLTDSASLSANGSAGGSGGAGGSISISASTITYQNSATTALSLSANAGAITDVAGNIFVQLSNAGTNILLGSNQVTSGSSVAITASATGTGTITSGYPTNGVTIVTTGNINVWDGQAGIVVGTTAGNGGNVTLQAGNGGTSGAIIFEDTNTPTFAGGIAGSGGTNGVGAGNGGAIFLTAATAIQTAATGPLVLSANGGSSSDNGGIVNYNVNSSSAITLGSASNSNLQISATGGGSNALTGDGGTVSVEAGGNLTVNTGGITAGPLGTNGAGAQLTLAAGFFEGTPVGTAGASKLLISSAINANGAGTGAAGSLTLQSNSTTAFNIGSTAASNTNGVKGTLAALAGAGGGAAGDLTVINADGGITNAVALTSFGSINFIASGTGGISIANALGSASTTQVNLSSYGSGSITQTKASATVTGASVDASTYTGSIGSSGTAFTINSASLTATVQSGSGLVNIADLASGGATVSSLVGSTGSVKISNTGTLTIDGVSAVSSVTLLSSAGSVSLAGDVDASGASTSTVSITSTSGSITATNASQDISAGKSVTLTAAKGSVTVGQIGNTLAPNTVTVSAANTISTQSGITANSTSSKITPTITLKTTSTSNGTVTIGGNILAQDSALNTLGSVSIIATGTANNAISVVAGDISAGGSVTLAASKGGIAIDTIGAVATTTKATLSALNQIDAAGNIDVASSASKTASSIALKTTSAVAGMGDITLGGSVSALNSAGGAGTVTISASGSDALAISSTGDISGTSAVSLTAAKGSLSVDTLGQIGNTAVITLSALNNITVNGAVTANSIKANAPVSITIKTATSKGSASAGNVTLNGAVTASSTATPTLGSVSVAATGTGAQAINAANDVSGSASVSLTASKGGMSLDSIGLGAQITKISLNAVTDITASGIIQAISSAPKVAPSITATTTGAGTGNGHILLEAGVEAENLNPVNGNLGTVKLTASGSDANVIDVAGDISAGASVTVTASKGGMTLGSIGQTDSTAAVNLTALSSIQVATISALPGTAKVAPLVNIKTTGTASGQGDITITGVLEANNTTTAGLGTVSIASSGPGATAISDASDISGAKSVTITASKGSATLDTIGTTLTSGTVSVTALNNLDVSGNISAGTSAIVKTTSTSASNSLSVNGISVAAGSISVVGAGGNVNVGTSTGAVLSADNSSTKVNTTITIEDSNTTAGNITVGAGTTIETAVGKGGNVVICIGAPPSKGIFGSAPTYPAGGPAATYFVNTKQVNPPLPAGPFFFGTNSITVTSTTSSDVTMNTVGAAQIIFNAGSNASRINIEGSSANPTTITADPPVAAGVLGGLPVTIAPPTVTAPQPGDGSGSTLGVQGGPALASTPAEVFGLSSSFASGIYGQTYGLSSLVSGIYGLSSPISGTYGLSSLVSGIDSLSSLTSGTYGLSSLATGTGATVLPSVKNATDGSSFIESDWVSDTELVSGQIPAVLETDQKLGILPATSSVVEMTQAATNQVDDSASGAAVTMKKSLTMPLTGGVSHNVGGDKMYSLRRGAVVFAPSRQTVVETPFGKVLIAPHAIALVISFQKGMAVYNLHDTRAGAVALEAGNGRLELKPGMHAVVTDENVSCLSQVNPAQVIRYRRLRSRDLGAGKKAFTGEFCLGDALMNVQALKQLICASTPEARKIAGQALKTTAIMMQIQAGGGEFQQVLRPQITACRSVGYP